MATTATRVGGPLLGNLPSVANQHQQQHFHERQPVASWKSFDPIITPPISSSSQNQNQRFILLPHDRFVTVLAYKTGRRIATLDPGACTQRNEDSSENVDAGAAIIESVCLTSLALQSLEQSDMLMKLNDNDEDDDDSMSEDEHDEDDSSNLVQKKQGLEQILLVGCTDGTIREFALNELTRNTTTRHLKNDAAVAAPIYPRRIFLVSKQHRPVPHITAPVVYLESTAAEQQQLGVGVPVYAIIEDRKNAADLEMESKTSKSKTNMSLVRMTLSPYDDGDKIDGQVIDLTVPAKESEGGVVTKLDRFKCRASSTNKKHNSMPFRLASTTFRTEKQLSTDQTVFIIVARSNTIQVYEDKIERGVMSSEDEPYSYSPVSFTMPPNNPLTAFTVSNNNGDFACGHWEGDIRILNDVLSLVSEYNLQRNNSQSQQQEGVVADDLPSHPSSTVLTRKLHWHAHPVTTLSYSPLAGSGGAMLYSGGDESVLVSWQLSRGTYRPSDVLPRLSKGGIVHISCATDTKIGEEGGDDGNGILVYCEDNTLQLFESHNRSLLWRVQGLSSSNNKRFFSAETTTSTPDMAIMAESRISSDPRNNGGNRQIVLCGMTGAPGYIHWYDPSEQRVSGILEVAPYNRVSRTEQKDASLPSPALTQSAFSDDGLSLLTVDATPTENCHIGARTVLQNGQTVGVTHTLRFWVWNAAAETAKASSRSAAAASAKGREAAMPYALVAAMTNPHGRHNTVSAMAMSKDGRFACTVSNDEGAFRLWHCVTSLSVTEQQYDGEDKRSLAPPAWVCQYKISTPSGYSNFGTCKKSVAFSSDGSLLAICYGNKLTLWDHDNATLLTSLGHIHDDSTPIDSVEFVKTNFLHDLILTKSQNGVTLQSPFGLISKDSWSYAIPHKDRKSSLVSHAGLIPSHDVVAVSLYNELTSQSRIILLDAVTGEAMTGLKENKEVALMWAVQGQVTCIGASEQCSKLSGWSQTAKAQPPVRFYALMNDGQMMLLHASGEKINVETNATSSTPSKRRTVLSATDAPVLNMPNRAQKRPRKSVGNGNTSNQQDRFENFGNFMSENGAPGAPLPSSDLPVLSPAFTRAFVGRNLVRSVETDNAVSDEDDENA